MPQPVASLQAIDRANFAMLYECIVSGQVPEDDCVLLLQDTAFSEYYKGRRKGKGTRTPVFGFSQARSRLGTPHP